MTLSLKALTHLHSHERVGRDTMGIHPLDIVVWGEPKTRLLRYVVHQLLAANARNGGTDGADPKPGDMILIPSKGSIESEEPGLFGLPSGVRRGIKAVALASIPEVASEEDLLRLAWMTLSNKATQYGVLFIGDEKREECESAFIFSMEGSHTRISGSGMEQSQFFDILMARLTHLAGAEVVSNWEVDYSMSREDWAATPTPQVIIDTGHKLREWRLLPDIQLGHYASPRRAEQIKLYLEVSGLTVGNMSAWDPTLGAMQITGSGVDKGNLSREEVLAIRGLNPTGNGTVVWAPPGTRRVKPSVEAFDHVLAYAASSLIARGDLPEYELDAVLNTLNGHDLAEKARGQEPFFKSMIHLHLWPKRALNPELAHLVQVEPRLYAYHSSCGTRPLALYSVEGLLRGMVENKSARKMIVVGLPNHGLLAAAPFPLDEMTDLFDPQHPAVELVDVPTS